MVINNRHYKKKKNILTKLIAYLITALIISGMAYGCYTLIKNISNPDDNGQQIKPGEKDKTVYVQLPGATKIKAIIDDYNNNDSIWMLVNKSKPISTDYVPIYSKPAVLTDSSKSSDAQSMRTDIHPQISNMFSDAENQGILLMIGSGYRSAAAQTTIYNRDVSNMGETAANQTTAKPGQSEHQTGLAMDIVPANGGCYISNCFKDTPEGIWLAENSYKYGFILRYPSGKESITGYEFEPWHFRYVGIDLATALHDSKLTLEEAWSYLESARNCLIDNGSI